LDGGIVSRVKSRAAWSPDGTRFAGLITYKDNTRPWEVGSYDARDGHMLWCANFRPGPRNFQGDVRFSRDGKDLFCEPVAAILSAETGRAFVPDFASNAVHSAFSP